MPLGNPAFIELNPRWVAEDRERFRQLKLQKEQLALGQLAVGPEDLAVTTEEPDNMDDEADSYSVVSIDLDDIMGLRPDEIRARTRKRFVTPLIGFRGYRGDI